MGAGGDAEQGCSGRRRASRSQATSAGVASAEDDREVVAAVELRERRVADSDRCESDATAPRPAGEQAVAGPPGSDRRITPRTSMSPPGLQPRGMRGSPGARAGSARRSVRRPTPSQTEHGEERTGFPCAAVTALSKSIRQAHQRRQYRILDKSDRQTLDSIRIESDRIPDALSLMHGEAGPLDDRLVARGSHTRRDPPDAAERGADGLLGCSPRSRVGVPVADEHAPAQARGRRPRRGRAARPAGGSTGSPASRSRNALEVLLLLAPAGTGPVARRRQRARRAPQRAPLLRPPGGTHGRRDRGRPRTRRTARPGTRHVRRHAPWRARVRRPRHRRRRTAPPRPRPLTRACTDWSEGRPASGRQPRRRAHTAELVRRDWVATREASRVATVTAAGATALEERFGVTAASLERQAA